MPTHLRSNLDGPLARITLDRPPVNVLSTEMLGELERLLETAATRREIRVIRIDAVGRMFSAGVDVADHVGERIEPMMDSLLKLFDRLAGVPQPIVAVVSGAALGGGCELVLGADLCLAAEDATFGQPEIRLGLFAPPASVLLPRLIGERRALDLLLTGRTLDAQEALRVGLVNAVFPAADFAHQVECWIDQLLRLSGEGLRQAKRAVRVASALGEGEAQRQLHRIYLDELMRTQDAAEGLASFLEKRSPNWSHR